MFFFRHAAFDAAQAVSCSPQDQRKVTWKFGFPARRQHKISYTHISMQFVCESPAAAEALAKLKNRLWLSKHRFFSQEDYATPG
jgi:hypothetical protein